MVCNYYPRLCIFTLLEVLAEDVVLFERHLFEAYGAHVMIITVIDVGLVRILKTSFERLPCCLWRIFTCDILSALRLIKDTSLAFDSKVLAQLVEPFEDRTVA